MRNSTRFSLFWNTSDMSMGSPKYYWRSTAHFGQKKIERWTVCQISPFTVRTVGELVCPMRDWYEAAPLCNKYYVSKQMSKLLSMLNTGGVSMMVNESGALNLQDWILTDHIAGVDFDGPGFWWTILQRWILMDLDFDGPNRRGGFWRTWILTDHIAGVDFDGPYCRGGFWRTWILMDQIAGVDFDGPGFWTFVDRRRSRTSGTTRASSPAWNVTTAATTVVYSFCKQSVTVSELTLMLWSKWQATKMNLVTTSIFSQQQRRQQHRQPRRQQPARVLQT